MSAVKINKNGFALPTVLIASIVMLMILLVSITSTSAVKVSLMAQNYNQLAQNAADAGIAYAKACLAANGNVPQWSSEKPLTPGTDCSGEQNTGFTCSVASLDARCSVALNSGLVAKVLVVAGGSGGNGGVSGVNWGDGGAGGTVVYQSTYPITTGTKTVTVGSGGAGVIGGTGGTGGDSVFDQITAKGGVGTIYTSKTGGSNSVFPGGTGASGSDSGGGAGAGASGNGSTAGAGFVSDITGSPISYAGGGGGVASSVAQTGGDGGGGSASTTAAGVNGTSNTGGGGGGGGSTYGGGSGGSGKVIISYPTGLFTATATNGSCAAVGLNTVCTFNTSGTFNVTSALDATSPIISTFSVGAPTTVNGKATEISSVGSTKLIRISDNTVWRQYSQNSHLTIPADTTTALTAMDVSGTAKVGSTLQATVTVPASATASFQWSKASTVNGIYTSIPGATASSYSLTASDLKQYVKVTATGTGSYTGTLVSNSMYVDYPDWIAGVSGTALQGKYVYHTDFVYSAYAFKTSLTADTSPQAATGLDSLYPSNMSLVNPQNNPTVDFSAYPAQSACRALGGRLPTMAEIQEIYNDFWNYGGVTYNATNGAVNYMSATQGSNTATEYYVQMGVSGWTSALSTLSKNVTTEVRCVKG